MINEHYTPEAVILANGEYPTCPVPLTMLEEASFVACCDGAANEYISRGPTPDVMSATATLFQQNTTNASPLLYIRYPIRKRTTRLKPSGICKREDSGELPLSERPANGKTIHWEISAYCWII